MGDDLLDRDQLLEAFNSIGVEHVDEALIDQIFCQLDLAKTGFVTSEQLISVIKTIQASSQHEEECSSPSTTTSYGMLPIFSPAHAAHSSDFGSSSIHDSNNSLHSSFDIQLFSSLDVGGTGLATTSALLTYWESIGVVCGHQVLADLGLGDTAPTIDLKELSNLLNDELNQSKDIISYPTITAAIATLQQEMRQAKITQDNITRERDKIKSDLQAATECSAALAVEIDEQNYRQEKMIKNQIETIKQEWMDNLKTVQSLNEKEVEKKQCLIHQLERKVSKEKENLLCKETKLTSEILTLEKENYKLEQEYNAAQKKANTMEDRNLNLQMELEATRQSESDCHLGTSSRPAAPDMEELLRINKDLKDRNDELEFSFQTQSERGRARKRGRRNSSSSKSKERRHHQRGCTLPHPNPMKRKGSPVTAADDLDSPLESPRGEKLRKSSHLPIERPDREAKQETRALQQSLKHELSLHSAEESPDRSEFSSSESLYQECSRSSLGTTESGERKMNELVRTVIYLKRKIKEFEKEMGRKSGAIKTENINHAFNVESEDGSPSCQALCDVQPIFRSGLNLPNNVITNENKIFNKLDSIETEAGDSAKETIIPHLLIDFCPMFSGNDQNREAEQHRKDLEKELDQVKLETVNIFSDITSYTEENSTLEVQNELLQKKIQKGNVLATGLWNTLNDVTSSGDNCEENIICDGDKTSEKEAYNAKVDTFVNNQSDSKDSDEISKLRLKIIELEQSMQFVEEKYESDKKDLINKNVQLEQSLELMKQEFESMEDYWQGKMDDERRFYEDQIRTSGEQFKELEDRLKEYIGLVEPENERRRNDVEALYTIDEACSMELQVTEWEEEISQLKLRNDQLCSEHEEAICDWSVRIKDLETENCLLSHKCSDLANLVKQGLTQQTMVASSLLCWCSKRAVSHSGLHTSGRPNFRLAPDRGPQSLPSGAGRLAHLRKYLQKDSKGKRDRRREEDLDPEQSSRSLDTFNHGGMTAEERSLYHISM